MAAPRLSVIVPAHQAASVLPLSLGALAASDLPRPSWELIVVDDASSDGTGELARRWADHVVTVSGGPHGPGYARNRGAEVAAGEWLVFIDADVVAHRDTLRRLVQAIDADPTMDAVFGAYDDAPPAPGLLSQYRNLLHRYMHLMSTGSGETFWAGCGAIRRSAFVQVGGFDERRYRRPQIEDIELGYRLHDHGHRIAIRPEIQGTHLKHWTLLGSLRTDLLERGIPWVLLLLERRRLSRPSSLNLKQGEPAKVILAGVAFPLLLSGAALRRPLLAGVASLMFLGVVLSNLPLFVWFARRRGSLFALAVTPLNIGYYLISGVSVVAAMMVYMFGATPPEKVGAATADNDPGKPSKHDG
ncbi:MAG: glycosyltransferase family 2 protein [Gemmatimonadales bacterium]|nr:glycosyltransferase family 2 protein [Gemmatimonadales bacterium]